jgi:small ligand-binding sensory domain FIST
MSVTLGHSVVQYFNWPYNEAEVQAWAKAQTDTLAGPATFGLLFTSDEFIAHADEIIEIVRIYAQVPTIIGCSASGLIADTHEIENNAGYCVALYHLPHTQARAIQLPSESFDCADRAKALHAALGSSPEAVNAWILFASPESTGNETWLADWDQATEHRTTVGGFAGPAPQDSSAALFINGEILTAGAVALGLEGEVTIEPLISHGCRPVGSPWTVTQAKRNIIHQIGNRPILEVLRDTLQGMSWQDQRQARGNIFIGLVLDEYKSSFGAGDFLVRNLAAIDPQSGAVAIATPLRIGQNLQFQIRDAQSAASDFEQQLRAKANELADRAIYGACLCDCIGRGTALYGVPDHDVSTIHETFAKLPIAGLFCNGEFGPHQDRTRLHGYAASLGLFVKRG